MTKSDAHEPVYQNRCKADSLVQLLCENGDVLVPIPSVSVPAWNGATANNIVKRPICPDGQVPVLGASVFDLDFEALKPQLAR